MAKSSGKVTIKKYANRRLYDTESSTYITLDRLAQMVREGREFEVVDAKTGEDITRQVLTQIIVDEEARGATMLPINFLKQLIGLYGNSMQNFVPQYLEAAMDAFQRNQSAVARRVRRQRLRRHRQAQHGDVRGCQPRPSPARSAEPHKPSGSEVDQLQGRARRAAGQSRQAEPLTRHASLRIAAALALIAASSLAAQTVPPTLDYSTATPVAGSWTYRRSPAAARRRSPTRRRSRS